MAEIDLAKTPLRDLNSRLQSVPAGSNETEFRILHPEGGHAIAVGLTQPLRITVAGHVGFYCGGMNQQAEIKVEGHCGPGVAENMMSGKVHIAGNASQWAGATGHGGLLVIEGDAGARCGISMKGIDIVVGGSVGSMAAFMAQAGNLVVLGDADEALGDSLYEARIFLRGQARSLGADCEEKTMGDDEREILAGLLQRAGLAERAKPEEFRLYGSARKLYNFHVDNVDAY